MTDKPKKKLSLIHRCMRNNENKIRPDCDDITRMKKCPECGSRNYTVSAPLQNCRIIRNGKVVKRFTGRYDAGNFSCDDCGYEVSV